MQKTSPPPVLFILCLSVFLSMFRFSAYSFKYIPYLDDYVQYFYYPTFDNPWQSILLGGPGVLFSRPLAGLFDRFFWGFFAENLGIAQIIICALHGASGVLFFKTLDMINLHPSPLFLVVYLLIPVNSEGTYWLSASTRIVVSMFLIAWSVYELANKRGISFAVLQFLSVWFYEQTAVLSTALGIIICVLSRQHKKIVFPVVTAIILALFYLVLGRSGDNAERLALVSAENFGEQASGMFLQLCTIFRLSIKLVETGFVRGMKIIANQGLWLWLVILLMLAYLFFGASKRNTLQQLPKGAVIGVLLIIVSFFPFLLSRGANFNFRNIVPALLGISLVADGLIMRIFRRLAPLVGAVLIVVFSVASLAEMTDYNNTSAADLRLAKQIAASVPFDAERVICKVNSPDYYPQSAPFGDHIKSMVASDWGATGIVRTLTGNREVEIVLIK